MFTLEEWALSSTPRIEGVSLFKPRKICIWTTNHIMSPNQNLTTKSFQNPSQFLYLLRTVWYQYCLSEIALTAQHISTHIYNPRGGLGKLRKDASWRAKTRVSFDKSAELSPFLLSPYKRSSERNRRLCAERHLFRPLIQATETHDCREIAWDIIKSPTTVSWHKYWRKRCQNLRRQSKFWLNPSRSGS